MGYRLHPPGARRLWLSQAAARYRPHRRDPGQRYGRRAALSHFSARAFSRVRPRTGGKLQLCGAAGSRAPRDYRRIASAHGRAPARDHRRFHARRIGQLHRRPHRQHLQLSRPQFRHRRGLRFGHGGSHGRGGGADRERLRCSRYRRHRPQYGRAHVREVLQDRGAFGHRHASVRGWRRWFRDGRGRGYFPAEAVSGCRARWRQNLRRAARHGRIERWQGQGHYRAQSGGPKAVHPAGLGECRIIARHRDFDRRPRHIHARGRCGGSGELHRSAQRISRSGGHGGARIGEIQHRTFERRGGRGGIAEDRAGIAR